MAKKKESYKSKQSISEETAIEVKKYLAEGGTITRSERYGKIIIFKEINGVLQEIKRFDSQESYENWKTVE